MQKSSYFAISNQVNDKIQSFEHSTLLEYTILREKQIYMKKTNLPDLLKKKKTNKIRSDKKKANQMRSKKTSVNMISWILGFMLVSFFIGLNFAYVKNRKVLKKREIRNQNIKKNLSCENVQNEKNL